MSIELKLFLGFLLAFFLIIEFSKQKIFQLIENRLQVELSIYNNLNKNFKELVIKKDKEYSYYILKKKEFNDWTEKANNRYLSLFNRKKNDFFKLLELIKVKKKYILDLRSMIVLDQQVELILKIVVDDFFELVSYSKLVDFIIY